MTTRTADRTMGALALVLALLTFFLAAAITDPVAPITEGSTQP